MNPVTKYVKHASKKRFRYLGRIYNLTNLYLEQPETRIDFKAILALRVGSSLSFVPSCSIKAYTLTRIK